MSAVAQALLAYAAVAAATGWLAWRWLARRRRTTACDRCGPSGAAGARLDRGVRSSSLRVLR